MDDLRRLLHVAMVVRRMVEDGHPNDPDWWRIMDEQHLAVIDLTDEATMDGEAAVIARLTAAESQREALRAALDVALHLFHDAARHLSDMEDCGAPGCRMIRSVLEN